MSAVGTVSARVNHLSFRNCSKTWARSKYLQSQRGCAPGGATGIATGAARRNRVRRDVEATAEPPLTSARPDRKRSSRDRFDTSGALQTLARWLYVEDRFSTPLVHFPGLQVLQWPAPVTTSAYQRRPEDEKNRLLSKGRRPSARLDGSEDSWEAFLTKPKENAVEDLVSVACLLSV